MTIAAWRELAHDVGARLGRQSYACRGGATSGGQRSLCERARRCVSGQAPRGREWFKKQAEKPRSDQHVISQWRKALQDLVSTPSTTPDGGWVRTGPVDAYLNR